MNENKEKRKKLIDISKHQGGADVDFDEVSKNIDGVILREGYRTTIDPCFLLYVEECKRTGIKIYSVYHFLYPLNTANAINEAISCVENVKKAGLKPSDIIIFADYEYDTVDNAKKYGITLTKHDCNQITEAFCAAITNLGYRAGVYMNLDYYKNYYIDAIKDKYPIWLADYNGDADYSCFMHQYTNIGRVPGIKGDVDMNYLYELSEKADNDPTSARKVIELARSWIGKNEKDGSHKEIIDIYNSYKGGLPRGIKMQYNWSWCACTWSALAIKLGYTSIMPIEISCGELVENAKRMDCWIENDGHIPSPGDAVLFDWDDSGAKDNVGWPDHVGLIDYVNESEGYFTTIEGNYSDAVKKRTVSINGKYIRGFIHPKYEAIVSGTVEYDWINNGGDTASLDALKAVAHEVISGTWGSGEDRKKLLTQAGYDYNSVQQLVNNILNGDAVREEDPNVDLSQPYNKKVVSTCKPCEYSISYYGNYKTTANLYLRNDAGKNKKALCIIPKGTVVRSGGLYTTSNGVVWPYINFIMNGVYYGGFSSIIYLARA